MATTQTPHTQQDHRVERAGHTDSASTVRWTSGTNIAAGAWLLAAPFVLGYAGVAAAVTNAIIVGLIVLGLAWYRTANPATGIGASWTNATAGGWLAIAPFVLGYADVGAAVANDVIVGLTVLTLGAISAVAGRKLAAR